MVGEVEEIELAPELAVVAGACLLESLEVGVEVGLREEGRAVDARQLRVLLVSTPVRAGEARELHRLDRRRVLEVWAAAEVREVALRVQRDLPLGVFGKLDLVGLRLLLEARDRIPAQDILPRPRASLGELAADLVLDRLQVALPDRLRELEVVVEAVGDRRADRDLHARMEPQDRLREQVSRRVSEDGEGVRVARVPRRQELQPVAVREREPKVADLAVDAREDSLLRELRADRPRGVERRRAVRELELGGVWEDHLHGA